jgi:hypothetical protein
MKKSIFFAVLLGLFFIGLVSANNYFVQYSQEDDGLIVKESINGINTSYVSSDSLEKTNGGYYFVRRIDFSENFSYVEIVLELARGFLVDTSVAYPANYQVESDGQNMRLVWKFNDVTDKDVFAFFIKIENTGANLNWLAVLIGILFFVAVAYFGIRVYLKKNINFEEHLMESEKKVIEELKKAEGNEMWQKQLLKNTGFSKAKLSRVIRDLGARELIKKVQYGNTNKIALK